MCIYFFDTFQIINLNILIYVLFFMLLFLFSDKYINYLHLATYDELLMYMIGLILFLAIIKLLRLLRFNRHVWTLVGTLIYARWDLFYFGITFFIYMFAFAILGNVVFGTGLIGFSSFIRTLESLYSMLLGKFNFNGLTVIDRFVVFYFF